MVYADGESMYAFLYSAPMSSLDPEGTMTVKPIGRPASVGCGKEAYMTWDFELDEETQIAGFIVQEVTVTCTVQGITRPFRRNPSECDPTVSPPETKNYWEAWRVQPGKKTSLLKKFSNLPRASTDQARFPIPAKGCGDYVQLGEIRFYTDTDILSAGDNISLWDRNRSTTYNSTCPTGGGSLPTTGDRPKFWDRTPVDGTAFRSFAVDWACGTKSSFAWASAFPSSDFGVDRVLDIHFSDWPKGSCLGFPK